MLFASQLHARKSFQVFQYFFPVSNQKVHLQHVYEPEVLLFFHADQQQSCSYKRLALPS